MKIRKEVHTRTTFAYEKSLYYFGEMDKALKRGGNICSNKWASKYCQARRIYIYYTQEFQKNLDLPLTK